MAFGLHHEAGVMRAIHRLIEQRVVTSGETVAILDGNRSWTYRELNSAANAVARRLMANGFRRGMRADVHMPPAVDLAVILLAVLKAGGCYTWANDASSSLEVTADGCSAPVAVLHSIAVDSVCGGPNLPVLSRETDIACVLDGAVGVPHATIAAMASCGAAGRTAAGQSPWSGEQGAFDLWAALLSGATAVVTPSAANPRPHVAFALRATA